MCSWTQSRCSVVLFFAFLYDMNPLMLEVLMWLYLSYNSENNFALGHGIMLLISPFGQYLNIFLCTKWDNRTEKYSLVKNASGCFIVFDFLPCESKSVFFKFFGSDAANWRSKPSLKVSSGPHFM